MSELSYGQSTKRIVFTESDHNHAKLILKLKHDGLTQAAFFRSLMGAYIEGDPRIQSVIDDLKTQSQKHKKGSQKLRTRGIQNLKELALNNDEIENIFDLLEEEYPDL